MNPFLKNLFQSRGAVLDKGAIYVVVILTLLIFGGYILVGGTLPTKLPNVNTNIVNLIPISVEPSKTSLQMFTFYGVTPTPYPTLPPLPTSSNSDPTLIDCNRDITGNQLSQMIWGFSFDQPPTAASENQPAFKAFYTSRNSLVLGSGVVSPMNQNPSGNTINPAIGDTTAKDTNNFVYYPSTFITDITGAANDASGDSQAGGIPNKPDYIYGTWKALGAVDPGANGLTLGTNEDALPAANGPPGDHNQTYSSEIVWKIANLKTKDNASLIPGHKYRIQIALHDGATPTNIGVACVQLNLPGTAPTPTIPQTQPGERGRVKVQNGTVLTDIGTMIRGAAYAGTDDAYLKHLHNDLKLNAIRVDVKTVQMGKTIEQQLPNLDAIVNAAGKNKMYVMMHYSVAPGGYEPLQAFKDFWTVVAPRYKDRTHVIYEMINEPTAWGQAATYTDKILADLKSVYDIMRAGAPNTHIVLFSSANLYPDCQTYKDMIARGTAGVDWTNASVGYHFYTETSQFGEANIVCLRQSYPLLMTETSYWVEYRPPAVQYSLRLQEKLGISWFSLDGKGGSATHLENEILPDLHAQGYDWPVEN